jgi:hypothetical protein
VRGDIDTGQPIDRMPNIWMREQEAEFALGRPGVSLFAADHGQQFMTHQQEGR